MPSAWLEKFASNIPVNGLPFNLLRAKSAVLPKHYGFGAVSVGIGKIRLLSPCGNKIPVSECWNVRIASCNVPTRSCARLRLFSRQQSSTANRNNGGFYAREPTPIRDRADVQSVAHCPIHLLSSSATTALSRVTCTAGFAR